MLMPTYHRASGCPGPDRALLLNFHLEWSGRPALLRWVEVRLEFVNDQQVLFESIPMGRLPKIVKEDRGEGWSEQLRVPLSAESIRFIEQKRRSSDVLLSAVFRFSAYELPADRENSSLPLEAFTRSSFTHNHCTVEIPQSEWVKVLGKLEWDEIELFELSKLPLEEEENLAEALDRIRDAREALRRGDYRAVLSNCRAAFESAAKHHQPNNVSQGFVLMFERTFKNEPTKVTYLNGVAKTLSDFMQQFGRHEQVPPVHPSRGEAEFVLTSTLGLFSMVSRRLAGKEI